MEPGKYAARPLSFEFGTHNDRDIVALRFRLSEGPDAGQTISYTGWMHTPASAKRVMESLEYCGWDGVSLEEMKGFGTKECELVLENEEYQGKTRVRVAFVNRLFGGPQVSYSKTQVSDLNSRMQQLNEERKREAAEKRGEKAEADPFGNG